jgi:ribonuclease III
MYTHGRLSDSFRTSVRELPLQPRDCEHALCERIGYHFHSFALLRQALTHKSYSNEQAVELQHNERLEFLGDAALGLAVGLALYRSYPLLPEGELTRIRSEVVSERALAMIGADLDIGGCLLLGRGEERSGGRHKASLLADALEALLGAIFCDGGLVEVQRVVELLLGPAMVRSAERKFGLDHKTRLQEVLQGRNGCPPEYTLLLMEGPDHQRFYTVEVRCAGEIVGRGRGRTKKAAEQEAAGEALARLTE